MRRRWAVPAVVAVLLAGCGGNSDAAAVRKVAVDFYTAFTAGDGSTACSLLTPREARSAGGAGGTPSCVAGLGSIGRGLPPATFTKSTVHGNTATATLTAQTGTPIQLTLVKIGGKWKVDRFM